MSEERRTSSITDEMVAAARAAFNVVGNNPGTEQGVRAALEAAFLAAPAVPPWLWCAEEERPHRSSYLCDAQHDVLVRCPISTSDQPLHDDRDTP